MGHDYTERLVLGLVAPTTELLALLQNRQLVLPRVTSLPPDALGLAGREVELPAVTTISPEIAATVANHWTLGLTTARADVSDAVPKHASLPDVTWMAPENLRRLAPVSIGLTDLSPVQAAHLRGAITLPALRALSVETATALVDNLKLRLLALPGITALDPETAAVLQRVVPRARRDPYWIALPHLDRVGPHTLGLLKRGENLNLEDRSLLPGTLEAIGDDISSVTLPRLPSVVGLTGRRSLSVVGVPEGLEGLVVEFLSVRLEAGDDLFALEVPEGVSVHLTFTDDRVITTEEAAWMAARPFLTSLSFTARPSPETARVLLAFGTVEGVTPGRPSLHTNQPLASIARGLRVSSEEGAPCRTLHRFFGWFDHTGGRDGWPGRPGTTWVHCGLTDLGRDTAERLAGFDRLAFPDLRTAEPDAWDLLKGATVTVYWDAIENGWMALMGRTDAPGLTVRGLSDLTPEQARQVPTTVTLVFDAPIGMALADALPAGVMVELGGEVDDAVLRRLSERSVRGPQIDQWRRRQPFSGPIP